MSTESTWIAVASDADGFVISDDTLREWAEAVEAGKTGWFIPCEPPTSVSIVRGSAAPKPQSDDPDEKFFRLPGTYYGDDVFMELGDLDEQEPSSVLLAWRRAQAAAKGLNAEAAK